MEIVLPKQNWGSKVAKMVLITITGLIGPSRGAVAKEYSSQNQRFSLKTNSTEKLEHQSAWVTDTVEFGGELYNISFERVLPDAPPPPSPPEVSGMSREEVVTSLKSPDWIAERSVSQFDDEEHYYYWSRDTGTENGHRPNTDPESIQYGIGEGYTWTNSCGMALIKNMDSMLATIYGGDNKYKSIGSLMETYDTQLTYGEGTTRSGSFPAYENGGQTFPLQYYWLLDDFLKQNYADAQLDFLQPFTEEIDYDEFAYNQSLAGYSFDISSEKVVESVRDVTDEGGMVIFLMARGNYLHYVTVTGVDEDDRMLISTTFIHEGELFPEEAAIIKADNEHKGWNVDGGVAWFSPEDIDRYFSGVYWSDGHALIGYTVSLNDFPREDTSLEIFGRAIK